MINTQRPLEEKMALFWHQLFATGNSKSLFEKYQAASRLSIKRVIATYTNVSLVLGNSS
jgi:hypothetical protein